MELWQKFLYSRRKATVRLKIEENAHRLSQDGILLLAVNYFLINQKILNMHTQILLNRFFFSFYSFKICHNWLSQPCDLDHKATALISLPTREHFFQCNSMEKWFGKHINLTLNSGSLATSCLTLSKLKFNFKMRKILYIHK